VCALAPWPGGSLPVQAFATLEMILLRSLNLGFQAETGPFYDLVDYLGQLDLYDFLTKLANGEIR
jgi:hypothetical protein